MEKSAESEHRQRKERLLALKREMEPRTEESAETAPIKETENRKPIFHNYKVADESLAEESVIVPPAAIVNVDELVSDQIEASKETNIVSEINLSTLAPRKIDWDLKRDVEKKLQKLDRRTKRAIAELIRERLSSGKVELLLPAMNSNTNAEPEDSLSDDDDDED